jgi:hypothetical protein
MLDERTEKLEDEAHPKRDRCEVAARYKRFAAILEASRRLVDAKKSGRGSGSVSHSRGKTMEEVAMILGFASRAVKLHLDKARRDLAAINVVHAVVVAVRRGFGPCCVFPLC